MVRWERWKQAGGVETTVHCARYPGVADILRVAFIFLGRKQLTSFCEALLTYGTLLSSSELCVLCLHSYGMSDTKIIYYALGLRILTLTLRALIPYERR